MSVVDVRENVLAVPNLVNPFNVAMFVIPFWLAVGFVILVCLFIVGWDYYGVRCPYGYGAFDVAARQAFFAVDVVDHA